MNIKYTYENAKEILYIAGHSRQALACAEVQHKNNSKYY